MNHSSILFVVIIVILSAGNTFGIDEFKITADDAEAGDGFGTSVSINGYYAIVGASGDDDDGNVSGSAYIFVREGEEWTQQQKLTADDAASRDNFGNSVSISGNYAVIGASGNDDDGQGSGSAYIFVRDGEEWVQQQKLAADDAAASDNFGSSVSIDGDYAIVGACLNDDDGDRSGSAYIFVRDGEEWTQHAKLTASDASVLDLFGYSVSISGDYAIAGAAGNDDDGEYSGSAYIFRRDGDEWTEQAKLTADDAAEGDLFGNSVSISGNYATVGAHCNDDDGEYSGSAYIFRRDGDEWTEQQKLTANDAAEGDNFGYSLSISGDYIIVGAHGNNDDGEDSGSAYTFVNEGEEWNQITKLTANDAAADDQFGISVSISGNYAIVGANGNDDDGDYSGSAYICAFNEVEFSRFEFYENVEPTDSNPDNLIEPGRNIRFKIMIVNELDRNILMGHGLIESLTESAEIVEEEATFNNIRSGQTEWSVREFEVSISDDFEPGEYAYFRLTVLNEVEPEGPWISYFNFPISPLIIGRILVDDDDNPDSNGDDDNIAEPGEIIEVIPLINSASPDTWHQVSGQLRFAGLGEFITVWDDVEGVSGVVLDTWGYNFIHDQQQPIQPDDENIQPEEDFIFEYSAEEQEAYELLFDLIISGYHNEAAGDEWDEGGVLMKWSSRFVINEGRSAPNAEEWSPTEFSLRQPYPNPFNSMTQLSFDLPKASDVSLQVFDLTGKLITTLIDHKQATGRYIVAWNGLDAPAGIYLVRMEADAFSAVRKVVLVK
ncbi:MAG: T9SS type A sorting domain-containing protein [Candidatus Hatepunaea meridiana]|nr:T9SS type A sorting domain-containing protein [Candidatus Hatepunaea meridiana]